MTQRRHEYYNRDGSLSTLADWLATVGNVGNNVAQDEIGDVLVSTVFLGLNYQWLPDGPPLIFETMIFGGPHTGSQWRYGTETEALAGHDRIVAALRAEEDPRERGRTDERD